MKIAKVKVVDLIIAVISAGVAMYIYSASADFPLPHESQLGAGVFPRILAVFLVFFGILIVLNGHSNIEILVIKNPKEILLSFCILGGYGLILKTIGFLLTTPIFIATLLIVLRVRKVAYVLSVALGATTIIYVIFKMVLSVPLPEGILGI